jgi:putative transposase
MPSYLRRYSAGGTSFFTVVTCRRIQIFRHERARELLGEVWREVAAELPFQTEAAVLLWDHLHTIWTLPEGDCDYSTRWKAIKARFTERWLASGGEEATVTQPQRRRGHRGVWQKRFWDRLVRDEDEFKALLDYIHYNPVKHRYVQRPLDWPHSTFQKWVARGAYDIDWGIDPDGSVPFIGTGFE